MIFNEKGSSPGCVPHDGSEVHGCVAHGVLFTIPTM